MLISRGVESVHSPAGSSVLLTTAVGLTTGISAKHTRNTVIPLVKRTFIPFKYGLNDLAPWLLTVHEQSKKPCVSEFNKSNSGDIYEYMNAATTEDQL